MPDIDEGVKLYTINLCKSLAVDIYKTDLPKDYKDNFCFRCDSKT